MLKNIGLLFGFILGASVPSAVASGTLNVFSYSSTNVTTSAYVVLWAATPASAAHLEICDTSGALLKIATGPTGSEKDIASVQVSGCVVVPIYITAGTQLNIKAISATASSGYNVVGLF